MITENELRIANESYTHKDFYQIYPEILDLVNKITERWDPKSSNESDPGVVLLKLLGFIADKLNYNIDKNILECFMPSATQEDSMRKLCEMMGYNMKYYQSAVADVSFMWVGKNLPDIPEADTYILLDRFTELQDDTGEINFVLTEPVSLTYRGETVTKKAIEGTLQEFQINDDNYVKLYNLDDNRRLYLPETQIAENGIWISNVSSETNRDIFWKKVDNLNTQQPLTKVWKFGYDNRKRLPYILFPEDISELIDNGLIIRYIRTSGATGNIAEKTLTKLTKLDNVKLYTSGQLEEVPIEEDDNVYLNIQNGASTSNGADFETIDQAYNSFKKTIGTFDTLVTCRDYANKIYQLVYSDLNTNPLVSNVQVSDIKDDLNLASKIVSFDEFGVFYSDVPFKTKTVNRQSTIPTPSKDTYNQLYYVDGEYYTVLYTGTDDPTQDPDPTHFQLAQVSEESVNKINHFDLYIYPLLDITNFYNADNYNNSFKPNYKNRNRIITELEDYKTLSHQIKMLDSKSTTDIYNIKNYYHLTAKISTTYKVSEYEASQILNNIYYALWNRFNARKLDYGEEIPFDELLECIETADSRIKVVSLDEPELQTNVMYPNGTERIIINRDGTVATSDTTAVSVFYDLISKNVLSGKLPLFKYDDRFDYKIGEVAAYSTTTIFGKEKTYAYTGTTTPPTIPSGQEGNYSVTAVTTEVSIPVSRVTTNQTYTLKENETVNLICPNLRTVKDGLYSAYVNYFFESPNLTSQSATACSLSKIQCVTDSSDNYLDYYLISFEDNTFRESINSDISSTPDLMNYVHNLAPNRFVWYKSSNVWYKVKETDSYNSNLTYYITKPINESNWISFLSKFNNEVYYIYNTNLSNLEGYLVDSSHNAYKKIQSYNATIFNGKNLYVCFTDTQKTSINNKFAAANKISFTAGDDKLGVTPAGQYITKDTEYQLKDGDKLYINYTDSNDVVHNITYFKKGNKYYKRDDIAGPDTGLEVEFSGIIKCNFDLYDSAVQHVSGYGKSYSKKSGYAWSDDKVPGMFSLDAQNQIEIRDFVKTTIKQYLYVYWSLSGNNTDLVLKKLPANIDPNFSGDIYEYVLNDDEYFFYTDSLKNSLVTLSSGTTLRIYSNMNSGNNITLKLNNSTVSLEDIASEGIGAFSDTKWVQLQLSSDYYLELSENQIITLSQGDTLTGIKSLSDPYSSTTKDDINNDWANIGDSSSVKYNGGPLPKFDLTSTTIKWKVRSNLRLDMSEIQGQRIIKDSNSNPVIQKIELYTSFYKNIDKNSSYYGCYVQFNENDLKDGKIEEIISSSSKLFTFTSSAATDDFNLKSNYTLNQPGGELISMHRYTVENKQKDDLYIYAYKQKAIVSLENAAGSTEETVNPSKYADYYYKLSFRDSDNFGFPMFIPENHMGLLMIYYSPSDGVDKYPVVSLKDGSTVISDKIEFYRKSYAGTITSGSSITLEKGINVIRINQSGTLWVSKQNQSDPTIFDLGTLLASEIDIVDTSDSNVTGLNYNLLNIAKTSCVEFVRDYLVAKDLDNIFYYNVPVDKYRELDVNKMDQYSWFNYNNICNKFVIAELDSDFSDIQISKSSRVSKW